MELISVIVPVYNAAGYLEECLDSIVKQTYTNLQIILIDDGSKDDSGVICDRYAIQDERIQVVHQQNMGVSFARNAGIALAKGKYLCFVDSDDWIAENYIEKLVNPCLDNYLELSICNICDIYPDRINVKRRIKSELVGNFKKDYYGLMALLRVPVVKLYRTDIIHRYNISFPIDIHLAEDQMFNFLYYPYVRNYHFFNKGLYYYRHNQNESLSKNFSFKDWCFLIKKLEYEKRCLIYANIENAQKILAENVLKSINELAYVNDDYTYADYFEQMEYLKTIMENFWDIASVRKKLVLLLIQEAHFRVVYCYIALKKLYYSYIFGKRMV